MEIYQIINIIEKNGPIARIVICIAIILLAAALLVTSIVKSKETNEALDKNNFKTRMSTSPEKRDNDFTKRIGASLLAATMALTIKGVVGFMDARPYYGTEVIVYKTDARYESVTNNGYAVVGHTANGSLLIVEESLYSVKIIRDSVNEQIDSI